MLDTAFLCVVLYWFLNPYYLTGRAWLSGSFLSCFGWILAVIHILRSSFEGKLLFCSIIDKDSSTFNHDSREPWLKILLSISVINSNHQTFMLCKMWLSADLVPNIIVAKTKWMDWEFRPWSKLYQFAMVCNLPYTVPCKIEADIFKYCLVLLKITFQFTHSFSLHLKPMKKKV
jgi:hypothetical protein